MPTLGNALDFAKLEGKNFRAHQLGAAPGSPVTGQLYYDTGSNTLFYWNGTSWIAAGAGAGPADATTSTKGIVQLAGDLAGTAASPQIASGAVVDADVNAAAAIQESKLTLATDAAVGTGSRRTLGAGAQQAMPGNRTLDAITAPAADVSFNTHKGTNAVDPTNPQDLATKAYVDSVVQGLDAKASARVATTGNVTLAGSAPNTVDGTTLVLGDRILVKSQTAPAENGIYTVTTLGTGANGTWTRATDADAWTEFPSAYVFVEVGTVNADTGWTCTVDSGGTLGTTAVTWVQFSSAGSAIAGAGLTKTGNTIDAIALAGGGISVAADSIAVDSTVARYYNNAATHGAGTTITITAATHGCGAQRGLHVQVQDNTTGNVELPDISVSAGGDVTVTYAASVSANTKLVTIIG